MNTNGSLLIRSLAVVLAASIAASAQAVVVTLTPGEINGEDTNTTSFTDGSITLTPLIGSTPATFNGSAARLGIDGQGTNNNAFNDPDTDPNNGNEEKLQFDFVQTSGLTQIGWDFSRADGMTPDDGVLITGFTSDPLATFSGRTQNGAFVLAATYDDLAGSILIDIPFNVGFANDDGFVDFGNPSASAGQTLLLRVADTDQAGGQLAITQIAYENDIAFPGDVNGDDLVTLADFEQIRINFFSTGVGRAQGDLTGDGAVTIADFEEWKAFFPGNSAQAAARLFGVPEPSSAALAAACLLLAYRRRT